MSAKHWFSIVGDLYCADYYYHLLILYSETIKKDSVVDDTTINNTWISFELRYNQ